MDIEHQTVIGIYSNDEACDKKSIINQLETIKSEYFGKKNRHFISCKIAGDWINDCQKAEDISRVHEEFDRFIEFINKYGYDKDTGDPEDTYCIYDSEKEGFLEASKDYIVPRNERIDIEGGDLEFENSFQLWIDYKEGEKEQSGSFVLYFGTDMWYADEEEELPDLGLSLGADMNDSQDEYFEFVV